jgi:hypothetical protein
MKLSLEWIQFRSKIEAMEEANGIFGENNVEHDKLIGDLEYQPIWRGYIRAPELPMWPDRVVVPVIDPSRIGDAQHVKMPAPHGYATNKGVLTYKNSGGDTTNEAFVRNPDNPSLWTFWSVSYLASLGSVMSISKTEMVSIVRKSNFQCEIAYKNSTYNVPFPWPKIPAFGSKVSFDTLMNFVNQYQENPPSTSTATGSFYKADFESILNPSSARDKIDSLVTMFFPEDFPLEDEDYGDLAMRASSKVNANNVNMIAFLRDIRKPRELIPRLRNLRRLAGASGEYLRTIYGILPTIDDLNTIVEAVRKIRPYLDKNGFSTYTASSTRQTNLNGFDYEITQRIKLAIDDTDEEFFRLIQTVDSWGFLPTFENVWDLVAYSFVVDWFVDIGGFLERVDTRLRLARLNIRYATMSRKTRIQGKFTPEPETPFNGSIDWVHYHRWVSDQCPVPPLSLNIQDSFDHWIEGSALLLQRTKR